MRIATYSYKICYKQLMTDSAYAHIFEKCCTYIHIKWLKFENDRLVMLFISYYETLNCKRGSRHLWCASEAKLQPMPQIDVSACEFSLLEITRPVEPSILEFSRTSKSRRVSTSVFVSIVSTFDRVCSARGFGCACCRKHSASTGSPRPRF